MMCGTAFPILLAFECAAELEDHPHFKVFKVLTDLNELLFRSF